MITVDGAAGGGQLLRTALSLSVVTGRDFEIESVRGARPEPGLKPQHLAAVTAAARACDATVTGATVGAETVRFEPGTAERTDLAVDVGTAGSVTLVFDTLLPVAAVRSDPLVLSATGGTDVTWSPTAAYHRFVKLPLLRRWGLDASLAVERTGLYPAGGGRATLSVQPWSPTPATLRTRGELDRVTVHSKASVSLADGAVADRQADRAVEALGTASLPATVADVEYVETDSPGSALLLCGEYGETLLGVDALGERGTTSETVAEDAVANFRDSHEAGAPVDAHAADQVMVVLALAGGRVRIPRVTDHVATNRDLLERFGSDLRIDHTEGPTLVASPHPALD